jgi:hypothetical protein
VKLAMAGCAIACAALLAVWADGGPGRQADGASGPVVRPAAPAGYAVPRGARRVSNARQLHAALARRSPRSVVLAPGTYSSRRPFLDPWGHRLYAERSGAAVLRAGLSLGGNEGHGGALVRGVVVDVDDPARTVDGAAIAVWGTGRGSRILDTTLRGHAAVPSGLAARQPDGLDVRRLVVRGFTDYGILVDANEEHPSPGVAPFRVEDVDIAGIGRRQPGSSGGRAEACAWIGNTGAIRRLRVRSCAWAGLWTGTATSHATFDGIDVDAARTGVYLEHFTTDSTFARVRVGPDVRVGLLAEWADPAWGRRPASVGNVIRDSRFESWLAGVYLDEGTTRTTVRDSTFRHQRWGAIGDYRGNGNVQSGNDFGDLGAHARAVRHDHLSSFREER